MTELEELLRPRAICESEYSYVLFHGTSVIFSKVNIDKSRHNTDFGKGFYLTSIFEQAVEWAGKRRRVITDLEEQETYLSAYVLKFELLLEKLKNLKIKIYGDYSEEWLDKIITCRKPTSEENKTIEKNDVTIGPMADNDIYLILNKYEKGMIGKEETLELLKFHKPNMQVAFHTEESLEAINFINNTCEFY